MMGEWASVSLVLFGFFFTETQEFQRKLQTSVHVSGESEKKTRNTKKKRDDSTPLKDKAEILEATAARFSHISNLRSPPTFVSASLE